MNEYWERGFFLDVYSFIDGSFIDGNRRGEKRRELKIGRR
jgi:hypothetical protein